MAGPSTREARPRKSVSGRTSGTVTAVPSIALLLALGLALRLIIAYVLLPGSGFPNDLASFQSWGADIAAKGPLGFYDRAGFIDYPPLYLLLLGVVGAIARPFGGMGEAVKLVPMVADLGLALVVWKMAQELGASRKAALAAAAVVILNPVSWINSSIWGQADVVGTILLLLGLRELVFDRHESAAALAVLATLTKIQLGILVFIVGFVVVRRSLMPRAAAGGAKVRPAQPIRILTSLAAGLAAAGVVCLPFVGPHGPVDQLTSASGLLTVAGGVVLGVGAFFLARAVLERRLEPGRRPSATPVAIAVIVGAVFASLRFDAVVEHIAGSFGEYPFLTVNAYNPWALVRSAAEGGMASGLNWVHDSAWTDASGGSGPGFLVGPFSAQVRLAGAALAVALVAGGGLLWRLAGRAAADAERAGEPSRRLPSELRAGAVAAVLVGLALAGLMLVEVFRPIEAAFIGDGLLIAVIVGVGLWAAWRDDPLSLCVALAVLAIAFFVVPTRAHERYLFPFFGVGAVLLALSPRWRVAYAVLAVANTVNLLAVLVEYNGIPDVRATDPAAAAAASRELLPGLASWLNDVGHWLTSARWTPDVIWPVEAAAIATGLAMLWALLQLRPRSVQTLQAEAAAAAGAGSGVTWRRARFGGVRGWFDDRGEARSARAESADRRAAAIPPARPLAAAAYASTVPLARWSAATGRDGGDGSRARADDGSGIPTERRIPGEPAEDAPAAESFVGPSESGAEDGEDGEDEFDEAGAPRLEPEPVLVPARVMRIWRRLARRSTGPDRSPSLHGEPHGRLDRLDLWVVVALAITVLSMRTFRLGEPAGMYFDEVYHARTAAEFLQDWRYGMPHDIYEWTHPHFAKYAIAGGLVLFSDDRVTASSNLGVPVRDALVQPREIPQPADPANPGNSDPSEGPRLGDRLYVATGSEVVAYDLQTRAQVARFAVPGAASLSISPDEMLYAGTADGRIFKIDTTSLDDVRLGVASRPAAPVELGAETGFAVAHLFAGASGYVLAADAGGHVVSVDATTGSVVGRADIPGATAFTTAGSTLQVVGAVSGKVTDASAEASLLASIAATPAASLQADLAASALPGAELPLHLPVLASDKIDEIQSAISAGRLPGIEVQATVPQVYVGGSAGITIVDARHLVAGSTTPTSAPVTDIALAPVGVGTQLYAAAGKQLLTGTYTKNAGGLDTMTLSTPLNMPGQISRLYYAGTGGASNILQALGRTPDGSGWTSYSVETTGNSVFSDARLPFEPVAWGADVTPQLPQTSRGELLAVAANGQMATVDIGQFSFAWRIMGVLFGALMAVCLYLLARILFRRRTVGLLVALFTVVDGMLFVQSRIAMNDTYVGGFLLLAYLIFAAVWTGAWRSRWAFWAAMPVIGVVLGFALASKWVALYAIASIGMLILIRSALGRLITVLGLVAGTGVLGYLALHETPSMVGGTGNNTLFFALALLAAALAIGGGWLTARQRTTPDRVLVAAVTVLVAAAAFGAAWSFSPAPVDNGGPNYTFFLIMLAVTLVAAAVYAYRPVVWTIEEVWFAILAPVVLGMAATLGGGVLGSGTLIELGLAGVGVGVAAAVGIEVGGRWGFGPLAPPPDRDDPSLLAGPPAPAPEGWLRLGWGRGLPAVWMAVCLLALPIAVYVASYVPWAMPWQPQTPATGSLPVLVCFQGQDANGNCPTGEGWPAGHTGKTLIQQTKEMYAYHNDLRSPHPASSPWWAWPADLKPVWFESVSYGQKTSDAPAPLGSMIYDGGNVTLWWLAIPGFAFACWQAFKRRSLALTLVGMAFFWQWLSWARIDRASFQYHFYTALPFFLLGLAYLLAELWHGPSRRTWLLARVAAAGALVAAPLLWLAKYPLCGLARVNMSSTNDQYQWVVTACGSTGGDLTVETRIFLLGVILVAALVALGLVLHRLERRQREEGVEAVGNRWIVQLAAPVVVAGVLLLLVGRNGPTGVLFSIYIPAGLAALVALPFLAILAIAVLTVRDPRRFVLGVLAAGVFTFIALYPNLSALPMPSNIASIYNGILPTWLYGFQFGVNGAPDAANLGLLSSSSLLLTLVVLGCAVVVAYLAWLRRIVVGYRRRRLIVAADSGMDRASEAAP